MRKIDIIIPVYKPDQKFLALVDKLEHQTVAVNKIIIMNTERQYFDRLVKGTSFFEKYQNVCVINLKKEDFDHGLTRRQGVEQSDAQVFVMMTMDAMPVDGDLVEKLTAPLEKGDVAVSYGRQMAGKNSGEIERYTRKFNYPGKGCEKSAKDVEKLGIKAFFCSNVCAAYRRDIYDRLGGFVSRTIFNEDMIYARKLIDAGESIAYAAHAQVFHSHNYSAFQQFRRNFDLGVSHAQFPDIFGGVKTEGEGIRLVKGTCSYLVKEGKPWLILKLFFHSGCKYLGFFLGKRYQKLPWRMVRQCSMNREYWK